MVSGGTNTLKVMNMRWASYQTTGTTEWKWEIFEARPQLGWWQKYESGQHSEEPWKEWTDTVQRYEALHLKYTVIPISYQILAELLPTALGPPTWYWCCQGYPRPGPCTGSQNSLYTKSQAQAPVQTVG